MPTTERAAAFRELVPLLFVTDLPQAAAFYQQRLGFAMTNQWSQDGQLGWCRLERDGSAIMLQQACEEDGPAAGRGHGVGFFVNCDDVDNLHAELSDRGLSVDPPQTAFYGMKQIFLCDPDGYQLCFQSLAETV